MIHNLLYIHIQAYTAQIKQIHLEPEIALKYKLK